MLAGFKSRCTMPRCVRVLDGQGDRFQNRGGRDFVDRLPLQAAVQTGAVDELHGEVRSAIVLADVVDLDDVRMLQTRDRFGLGRETSPLAHAGVRAGDDRLDGDRAIQLHLSRPVDHAHAAASQLAHDFIAGQNWIAAAAGNRWGRQLRRRCRAGGQILGQGFMDLAR